MDKTELYDKAMKAITALFGDKSVSSFEAIENLKAIKGEIDIMIEALENDNSAQISMFDDSNA